MSDLDEKVSDPTQKVSDLDEKVTEQTEKVSEQAEDKAEGVQVFYKDESIWATQKAMAMLFDCSTDNIGVHLKNIFESGELQQEATTEKISVVQIRRASARLFCGIFVAI